MVADIAAGVHADTENRSCLNGEIGLMTTTCVLTGTFAPEQNKAVTPSQRHRVTMPVRGGTVLVSRINTAELVGTSAFVPENVPNLFLPDRLWQLRPAKDINAQWLNHAITGPALRAALTTAASGTSGSMKYLSQATFLALPVAIPSRSEQDAIVAVLQTWDEGIAALTAILGKRQSTLSAIRRRLLSEVDADYMPFGSFVRNRNQLLETVEAARLGLSSIELEHMEGGTGQLLGSADPATLRGSRRMFSAGNVLYGRLRPYLRKFAAPLHAGVCSTEVWVFAADEEQCDPAYLYQLVQDTVFADAASKSTGSRMPRADWSLLSETPFPLPSLEHQQRVAALLGAEEKAVNLLADLLSRQREQKRALMSRLLSGSLRIPPSLLPTEAVLELADA